MSLLNRTGANSTAAIRIGALALAMALGLTESPGKFLQAQQFAGSNDAGVKFSSRREIPAPVMESVAVARSTDVAFAPEQPAARAAPQPRAAAPRQPESAPECVHPDELGDSLKPLASISLAHRRNDATRPADCYAKAFPHDVEPIMLAGPRSNQQMHYFWFASNLAHNPLYFEDVALERYGQGHRPLVQPFVSGARFFGQAALFPYQVGLDHQNKLQYVLGYCRPGSPAPAVRQHLPWSWRGAALQAGAVASGVAMFPIY